MMQILGSGSVYHDKQWIGNLEKSNPELSKFIELLFDLFESCFLFGNSLFQRCCWRFCVVLVDPSSTVCLEKLSVMEPRKKEEEEKKRKLQDTSCLT